jgi:hypothetical protein
MKTFSKNILQKTIRRQTGFSEHGVKFDLFRYKKCRKKSTGILNKPEYFSLIKQATKRVFLFHGIQYPYSLFPETN